MAYYETDSNAVLCNNDDTLLSMSDDDEEEDDAESNREEQFVEYDDNGSTYSDGSEYSLDYEYVGPRNPNYRSAEDPDSDASELSDSEGENGFDMWDEDPYSTNDYTWESNDMKLTSFIKKRQNELRKLNATAPWQDGSFWRKEKGWPRQLPSSCSTTNHDQSANALCLVLSNFGLAEHLYAVYRDRIIECGRSPKRSSRNHAPSLSRESSKAKDTLTWIESDQRTPSSSSSSKPQSSQSTGSSSSNSASSSKFCETHLSVSLRRSILANKDTSCSHTFSAQPTSLDMAQFLPFTKYIRRSDFPPVFPEDAYLPLDFEPLCLAQKYGYMAIGGIEGEFELYCCMDQVRPRKIWGTKFKSKNNVQLMTNAVQIVRWEKSGPSRDVEYDHMLIACMNEAGVLVYKLPSHKECQSARMPAVQLHTHLRCFDRVPVNDAKVSHDGRQMVCVGDDSFIFLFDVVRDGEVSFSGPTKIPIPHHLLGNDVDVPYSSQYVAWSSSSKHFAHTSDTHSRVLVWRADTRQVLYSIDAAGYTYAIAFHPRLEGVLVFTNRYGYFHTVDLEEAVNVSSKQTQSILTFDSQTVACRGHTCNAYCITGDSEHAANHTLDLHPHHEVVMVAFRGERDRRLRILAKINGIQWSRDGRYLYVATKKRVLAYEFLRSSKSIGSLFETAGAHARRVLEQLAPSTNNFRKRKRHSDDNQPTTTNEADVWKARRYNTTWYDKWLSVPAHVRHRVIGESHLASHWKKKNFL